jgi:hypothetical protein
MVLYMGTSSLAVDLNFHIRGETTFKHKLLQGIEPEGPMEVLFRMEGFVVLRNNLVQCPSLCPGNFIARMSQMSLREGSSR